MIKVIVFLFYKNFDIIGLQETFLRNSDDVSSYFTQVDSEYETHVVNRDITHPNAKRGAGGVALLYRKDIKNGVKILHSAHRDIIWLKLTDSYFGFDNDVYICFVYMTTKESTVFHYTDADYWSNLEDELAKYQCKGEVILMGDFNARTATLPDYILPAELGSIPELNGN